VLHDRELQAQFSLLLRLLPRFLRFFLLVLFVAFFYSLFGMSIFSENKSSEGLAFFGSVGTSRPFFSSFVSFFFVSFGCRFVCCCLLNITGVSFLLLT
jgi:hypothetical protein